MHLHDHLIEGARYQRESEIMSGAVRFAAESEQDPDQLFWAKATIGDLDMLTGTPDTVRRAYKDAIAVNDRDWFALDSVRRQLAMLQELGFRAETVEAGIATVDRALARLNPPEEQWEPRQVFLFSGHIIDAPDRPAPRFPADKEGAARAKIEEVLDRHGANAGDLAYCQAAAGGDILFLEACQQRGVRCRILLPFDEPAFLKQSVLPSTNGNAWRDRYYTVAAAASVRIMPDELGPPPEHVDAFERCNLWLLYSALACGIARLRFVCLWNGSGGDGLGGTAHMYNEVSARTGRVDWIDVRTL